MEWLQAFAAEFAIAAADPTVWLSIGEGLLFGGVCLLFGIWVARLVGLLGTGCAGRRDPWRWPRVRAPRAGGLVGRAGIGRPKLVHSGRCRFRDRHRPGRRAAREGRRQGRARRSRRPAVGDESLASPSTARRNVAIAVLGGALFVVDRRTGLRIDVDAESARWSPARRLQRHCVLRDPWQGPGSIGNRSPLLAVGLRGDPGVADPDLVPLGRDVARGGRDHDLRHDAPRCTPLHGPAAALARGGGIDRHDRSTRSPGRRRAARSCSDSSRTSSWRLCR